MAVKPFSKFFLIGFSTICLFAFICFLRLQSSRESDRALSLKKKDSFDADIIAYKKKKRFNSLSINTSTISSANSGSFWADIHDKINLEVLDAIIKKHSEYKNRKPFPHLVEDNMFPDSVLYTAAAEIPDSPSLKKAGCISSSSKCFDEDTQKFKNAFDSDYHFGPATATLFSLLKSSMFIKFLEKLTGIDDLIPDPHYRGSGIHQTMPGGHLNIHADFNRYARYDMHRRVNVFIYLNPNWTESYGGHLELWSKDLLRCEQKVLPTMGRFVAFSSTDFSYHGHQKPLSCPPDRSRRSLAMYYYTRTRPASECLDNNCNSGHSTLFQKTKCATCEDKVCLK